MDAKRATPAVEVPKAKKAKKGDVVVELNYDDLKAGKDLTHLIEEAFGFDGMGILCVRGVPDFLSLRSKLLPLAYEFAQLPEDVRKRSEHAASHYSFGWSHGKEKFNGKADHAKGSYYANPQYDRPVEDKDLIEKYPAFVHPNIWPDDLPELAPAFKACGQKMVEVGLLVAAQCDRYIASKTPNYGDSKLKNIIAKSRCCKARLLHYFNQDKAAGDASSKEGEAPSWCGWHNDHGSLTALCPGMFLDLEGNPIDCPDPGAGLHVRTRAGKTVRVAVPGDGIAFQIGETAQIHSGGILQATPHSVKGGAGSFTRESFAVFMEPEWDEAMDVPTGEDPSNATMGSKIEYLPEGVPLLEVRWENGSSFADFTEKTLKCYYD